MDDSPPFAVLKQNADAFKCVLDADVAKCLATLDAKISSLMTDPGSLSSGTSSGNPHVEFSMAKYKILAHVRNEYEEMEREWMDRLDQMKTEFMENVEIFLANTKLEVKLPLLKASPRSGIRNSPSAAKQDKSPSAVASIYPKLFNTAKHIPVLGSLLPQQQQEEESSEDEEEPMPAPTNKRPAARTPKRVTINTVEQYIPAKGQNGTKWQHNLPEVSKQESDSESEIEIEEEPVVQTPVKRAGRGRKSVVNTPASAKKETVSTPLRGRRASKNIELANDSSSSEEKPAPVMPTVRSGRKSLRAQPVVEVSAPSTPGRRGRTPRKKANEAQPEEVIMEEDAGEDVSPSAPQRTPNQVQFSLGLDVNEELDIYSPELNLAKSAPRRKTMVTHAVENFQDVCLTPEVVRGRSKRKTIGGNLLDQSVAPSPKRLKRCGGRSSLAPSALDADESNLLESEGAAELDRYSPWIPLSSIAGSVPTKPGVYELKVAQAKKPAYIGSCDSLRQRLTLHKMAHHSGKKHLDKFVERNRANVLVRYENADSEAEANETQKARVKEFVERYKTLPAYN